ncbi:MAG: hypothetical protein HYV15_01625 [Elusimicrobia bacterium]|nr:hypothetical protein [Elusimicrobiota bacterium]
MAAAACPSCSRPVQLGKPTCLYCGAPTGGAAAAVPPAPSPEPATVASADDLQTLLKLAMDHAVQGRPAESQRIMGKVFTEVSGKDIQDLFDFALPLWCKSLQGGRHAAALPAFEAALRAAVGLGAGGRFAEAFQLVLPVLQAVGADPAQHAMLPLLCIGLKGAAAAPRPAPKPAAAKTWDPTRIVEPGGAGHNWDFGKA